jgi:hypothetical protein
LLCLSEPTLLSETSVPFLCFKSEPTLFSETSLLLLGFSLPLQPDDTFHSLFFLAHAFPCLVHYMVCTKNASVVLVPCWTCIVQRSGAARLHLSKKLSLLFNIDWHADVDWWFRNSWRVVMDRPMDSTHVGVYRLRGKDPCASPTDVCAAPIDQDVHTYQWLS